MAFVKEYRKMRDEFPEWEYLTEIGVRNMFGEPIKKGTIELVVDREKNYFLISQGHTNINRDDREIHFYALCLDGVVLNMETVEKRNGSAWDCTFECHWDIEKIKFPVDWTYEKINKDKLIDIITEAFKVETYSRTYTLERTKKLTVTVSALLDGNSAGSDSK